MEYKDYAQALKYQVIKDASLFGSKLSFGAYSYSESFGTQQRHEKFYEELHEH